MAHARQNGQHLGRPLTAALHADQVRKLYRGGSSKAKIARRLQIGRTSVRRILAANRRRNGKQENLAPTGHLPNQGDPSLHETPDLAQPAGADGPALDVLHDVLQLATRWDDSHMHEFRISQKRFGKSDPSDRLMGMDPVGNERTTYLYMVLGKVRAKAMYTYDFGDGWEHESVVEKVLPPDPGVAYPSCVGGKLQGPPDDCGGILGYYNLLEAICDPAHPEHKDLLDWVDGEFDPDAFSVEEASRRLAPIQRWWAKSLK